MTGTTVRGRRRGRLLALALLVFSPFVGEFLLGNTAITELPALVMLSPMYGAGALLIRETARRTAGGWRVVIPLAAAYALVEEGVVDQMLFNPAYLGLADFTGFAPIPHLGMSATLTLDSLVMHTVWSICVPIAVIEAFDVVPTRPWLGRVGMSITASLFVLGCIALALMQYERLRFVARPAQFAVMAVAIGALVAVAARNSSHVPTGHLGRTAPRPAATAVAAFVLSSGYWLIGIAASQLSDWLVLVCSAPYVAGAGLLLDLAARRPGWDDGHVFGVAAGCLLTYVWVGVMQSPYLDVPRPVVLLGNAIFGAAAIAVLTAAARARRRGRRQLRATSA